MNYIDHTQIKIQNALTYHNSKLFTKTKNKVNNSSYNSIKNFLTDSKIIEILTGDPIQLYEINDSFYQNISNYSLTGYINFKNNLSTSYNHLNSSALKRNRTKYNKLNKEISRMFNYENSFSLKKTSYSTYNLANKLDISTCTYCNRIYTKTVINPNKITRPEFDHWFPKSKYPLLALSFFNLIPSCHICNSNVKGDTDFTLATHNHPYLDKSINLQFSYDYDKNLNNHKFKINYKGDTNNKARTTSEEFKLKEIYETHEEEIADLLRIKNIYSTTYLDKLKKLLKNNVSDKEIYRLAFGAHIEESKFDKRPLSRMKRDILKELGIIK